MAAKALDIAIQTERDGIKYYGDLAGRSSDEMARRMWSSLVEDERKHLKILEAIASEMGFPPLDSDVYKIDPKSRIRTIFSEALSAEAGAAASEDEVEALKTAMGMERRGFEMYEGMAADAKVELEQALFKRLAYEEEQHYDILEKSLAFLADTGHWFLWEERAVIDGGGSA